MIKNSIFKLFNNEIDQYIKLIIIDGDEIRSSNGFESCCIKIFLMRKKPIVNKKRPVNLDLMSMKFPPMAIASILHRISGIALFLLLPVLLYILSLSLYSPETFAQMQIMLTSPIYKSVLWAFGASLIYHIIAGIRHILMDIGFGEHLSTGRRTAILVIVLAVIFAILLGVWIW